MKYLPYAVTLFFYGTLYAKNTEPFNRNINFPNIKIQKQIPNSFNVWSNYLSSPVVPSSRNDENLHGIWIHEFHNTTLLITTNTNQSIPNPVQTQGVEPSEGNIGITGTSDDNMNYMFIFTNPYYDGVQIFLGNNPLIDTEGFDYFAGGNISEDVTLPYYFLEYESYPIYNVFGGELLVVDTLNGDLVENWYVIENSEDPVDFDSESMRITIDELTVGNNGLTFFTLSGSLSPGTLDIEAGVETQIAAPLFTSGFGPVNEGESMQWQFNSDGTGYEITSGGDYYELGIDTTEISWDSIDDSLYISSYDEEDDSYETINLLYLISNDSLYLDMTIDYCEGMDDYYYMYCSEMVGMMLGIDDIDEVNMKLDVTMSSYETGFVNIDSNWNQSEIPSSFSLHQNYPNPFNPTTTLQYDLPMDGLVNITIYDMLGNVINQLVNEVQNSGFKTVKWDATNNQSQPVSAGVYLYSIEAGDFRQTKKDDIIKIELFLCMKPHISGGFCFWEDG